MNELKELRDKLGNLQTELDTLGKQRDDEKRSYTKEETDQINKILDEMDDIEARIATLERLDEAQKKAKEPADRNKKLDIDVQPAAEEREYKFGEFILDCVTASREGGRWTPRLENHQKRAKAEIKEQRAISGLGEKVPADGGFLLTTDYSSELIKNAYSTGILVNRCRKIPMSTNAGSIVIPGIDETSRADGSRHGGIQMYWAAEGDEKTASKPKFRRVELKPSKLVGLIYLTDELMQDVVALEAYTRELFAEELGFKLDDAIVEGTGAGQPLGFKNSGALVSVAKETSQAADTIVAENVEKMYARAVASRISNYIWLINQDCWPQIFQLHHAVGTGGAPMFMLPGTLPNAPNGALLGRPIVPIEQCETLGDKGDIYFVDLSRYLITDKGAMQSALSIHVRFVYDETVLRFVYRVDGQSEVSQALTPFKSALTQSPFITLDERA